MSARTGPRRITALMNQKGGVGKTTTTVNLGAALAQRGHRVLLIDLDPQAHLTLHVGIDPTDIDGSVYDLLLDADADVAQIIRPVTDTLSVLPAEVDLAGAETELVGRQDRHTALRTAVDQVLNDFDYVLIDCPPSLGLLTLNALTLAREVIVPLQAHFLALQGLSKLLETVQMVAAHHNPALRVAGVVLCLHDAQTKLAGEVIGDLQSFFTASRAQPVPWAEAQLYEPAVRRNIKLAECPSFGQTVFQYAPTCAGAQDYEALAESLVQQDGQSVAPHSVEVPSDTDDTASTDADDEEPPLVEMHVRSSDELHHLGEGDDQSADDPPVRQPQDDDPRA